LRQNNNYPVGLSREFAAFSESYFVFLGIPRHRHWRGNLGMAKLFESRRQKAAGRVLEPPKIQNNFGAPKGKSCMSEKIDRKIFILPRFQSSACSGNAPYIQRGMRPTSS
jgi:hypothetical protein